MWGQPPISWLQKPASLGQRMLALDSKTPNRSGSAADRSGNHQPCWASTIRGWSESVKCARMRMRPRGVITEAQSPSARSNPAAV